VADDVAPPQLAIADHHFLDAQVVGHLLVAAGAGQYDLLDLLQAASPHGEDVATAGPGQLGAVLQGVHAGIAHHQDAVEPPPAQILADALHHGAVVGVARQDPAAHRQSLAGHGQRDHHLRRPGALLGVPEAT